MKKVAYISLLAVIVLSAVAGCKGSDAEEEKLGSAAPPPTAGATPEAIKTDKNRPGAAGPAGAGPASTSSLAQKPAGQ